MKNLSIPVDIRLGGIDASYFQADHSRRFMTITAIWTFKRPLEPNRVYDALDKLCIENPRFARVPRHGGFFSTPALTIPVGWHPKDNVIFHTLEKPNDKRMLQKYCAKQVGIPFDYSKPLWQIHVIYGLDDNHCAVFWKAHHSIADGEGLIRTLLSTTSFGDTMKKMDEQSILSHREKIENHRNSSSFLESKLPKQVLQHLPVFIVKFLSLIYMSLLYIYIHGVTFCHDLYQATLCLTPFITRKDFYYEGLQSHEKDIAWSENIPISDIKIVRQAFGGTLNDVMLAVVTRCIKSYLESIRIRQDDYVGFLIPVSLRQLSDWSLQNVVGGAWGFFSMKDLGTKQLINQVRTETLAIKSSWVPFLVYETIERFGKAVPGLSPPLSVINHFCDIPHGVFTNVPGPAFPISFAGEEIQEQHAISPQCGKGTVGIALFSYCGQVSIGVLADVHRDYPGLVEEICKRFVEEFEFILDEAKMELSKKKTHIV
ncbi:MAG: hypothetical protein EXX96DRAFT_583594 [Benjaminiella poitrasii]|nr:MAG: hypothetical protein EXX96DRAFT_583594 [Benjaminiella poitrasii]